jgi:hypothetical protein
MFFINGAKGTRTPDPHTASVMRSQLRHSPPMISNIFNKTIISKNNYFTIALLIFSFHRLFKSMPFSNDLTLKDFYPYRKPSFFWPNGQRKVELSIGIDLIQGCLESFMNYLL